MLRDFISLFFPECCMSCSSILIKGEKHVCSVCYFHLPLIDYMEAEHIMKVRFYGRVETEYVFAYLKFIKGGIAGRILHALKYEGQTELGTWLGMLLGNRIREMKFYGQFDLVVPVPVHPRRFRQRGYNQCDYPAKAIGKKIGADVQIDAVARVKYTGSFTKKGRLERNQSLDAAFRVIHPDIIRGKHILIVDDVVTTGSTIESLASCLKEAGAEKISIAALSVAV